MGFRELTRVFPNTVDCSLLPMDLSQNIIQQQWMSYGLDSETGNDTCTLTGNRAESSKHVIPAARPTPRLLLRRTCRNS
ncbi:hypothetical protein NKI32_13035 [Mesorhizobium sp. M0761]|uniref:hypothetical protein n=1 Tax=Mesorhizobium sp. M0761 TaxID=2956994 RepID=UPI003337E10C